MTWRCCVTKGKLTPDLVFRDPYILDFLGLADSYAEKDLESAIVAELQRFIIELGQRFCLHGAAKTHHHRHSGLLHRPAVLPPTAALFWWRLS